MRRSLLLLAPALALLAGAVAAWRVPLPRPRWNVVLVVVDTLRADHLGAYGYPRRTSPHLDDLAREASLFTQARSQASCTFPSVNSLLTSRYPAAFLGQAGEGMAIPPAIRSLPEMLAARGWSTAAVSASPIVRATPSRFNPTGGFDRGFQRFDESCAWLSAACVTGGALSALDRLREPFLLYLHYLDPHGPYQPPQPYRHRLRIGRATTSWSAAGDPRPLEDMLYKGGPRVDYTPADIDFLRGLYDGDIALFDDQLGRLLGELRRRRLLERTVLVVAADHGESFLDHGDMGHCRSVHGEEVTTPLLVRRPHQRRGARIAGAVQNLDIVPTVLDLLGMNDGSERLEGTSLRRLLGGAPAGDRYAYSMINDLRSVSDGRFALIRDQQRGTVALYDLAADPGETRDVQRERRPDLARLRRRLLAWIARSEGAAGGERGRLAIERLKALGYL